MFDKFLKPKFYRKCKPYLDCTKSRLEAIRNKRKAVLKFLKKDIADLLKNGLDDGAYGRAEGFLVEENMSACYELVVKFVGCVSDNLQVLSKESNCPDECKEAIPSLIYAAARFSDLPELRNLRTLFREKFGDSLEPYISKEFLEKSRPQPTKEMKIQILNKIAQEFCIKWNSRAMEEKLNMSYSSRQERPRMTSLNSKYISNNEEKLRLQSSSDDETSTSVSSQSQDRSKTRSSSLGSFSEDDELDYYIKKPSQRKIVPPHPPRIIPKLDVVKEQVVQEKPKPMSVRTRGPRTPRGLQKIVSDIDSSDEEDRVMDKLLMRYSMKRSSSELKWRKNNAIRHIKLDSDEQHKRVTSLPAQLLASVEPEMQSEGAKHVHPKLPDYDDLTARLASIRR
ncbi:hypothetical protein QN277_022578 [Acacia crassicarpa]|uniref:Regulator of Vps4 activity in the MVB pathway protein n=1 Tax=Acacia crassicarpa TaxID=499986 RepID=A0AAE1JH48_9FABA|nr:hypothetical protein QN277_022578 [Acacia crassicarpa]